MQRIPINQVLLFLLQERYADLCSVIGMVASEEEDSNESLIYCLKGTRKNLVAWGHEFLRSLAGQIGKEYEIRVEKDEPKEDIN